MTLIDGYGITDCGVKWGKWQVGRGLFADLAVVMTEYGCSLFSCACGFSLKSLNYDLLRIVCWRHCVSNFVILRPGQHLG